MSDNIIDFFKAKSDVNEKMSHHIVSLDLFLNSDNSMPWARVSNVDEAEVDADWHRFIADQLRHLAWISDGMAADMDGEGRPIAAVSVFDDRRISTRWNDDLVNAENQVKWVRNQVLSGIDEISAAIAAAKVVE